MVYLAGLGRSRYSGASNTSITRLRALFIFRSLAYECNDNRFCQIIQYAKINIQLYNHRAHLER